MSASNVSPNTIKAYRSDLGGLFNRLSTAVDTEDFEAVAAAYLTDDVDAVAARTTRRRLAAIRSFAKWAGIVNPLSTYRPPTPAAPTPHPIPEGIDGVQRMCRAADRRSHRALVALCGLAGLRVSEACSVMRSDIAIYEPFMPVREPTLHVRGKGRKERDVPLSREAWRYIAVAWTCSLDPNYVLVKVGERRARQIITRLGYVALGHHVASHDLRATFATATYAKTKDLRVVADLLGHSKIEQTMVYTGVSEKAKRDAVEVS